MIQFGISALALLVSSIAPATDPMAGKIKTDTTISFQMLVDTGPQEVFALWTTEEGADQFFGSASRIDARLGGLYEIDFGLRPDGKVAGPRGTRILRFAPASELWFEWACPYFAEELNTEPKPTWVELRFEEFSEDPPRTLIYLDHYGFGQGPKWDRVYSFFERGWFDILYRLKQRVELGPPSSDSDL